jgi:hypothetical protein
MLQVGATEIGEEEEEEEDIIRVIKSNNRGGGHGKNALKILPCHNLMGREHFEKK